MEEAGKVVDNSCNLNNVIALLPFQKNKKPHLHFHNDITAAGWIAK